MPVCLFDLDGTLIDSTRPIRQSMDLALAQAGLDPMTDLELTRHIGPPLQWSVERLLVGRGISPESTPRIIAAYRSDYARTSLEMAVTYPGIPDLLARVGARHPIGVVTSKPLRFTGPILDVLHLSAQMVVIEGPDLAETEPKYLTLRRALDRLAVAPSETVLIGDRSHDIEAAVEVGTHAIGVTWGYGSRRELADAGAIRIVDSTPELSSILLSWDQGFSQTNQSH